MLYIAGNFCNLIREVSLDVLSLFFCDFQEGRNLYFRLESLLWVERDDIASLALCKKLLLLFILILHISRQHYSVSNLYATLLCRAVSIELAKVTLQHVAFLVVVNLLILTATRSVSVNLVVHHLLVNLNVIVCYLVAL